MDGKLMRFAALAASALLWGTAQAQMNTTIVWNAAAPYEGPGDITSFTAWYGLRGYSQAYAQPGTGVAARVRRASDSTETDIVILPSGDLDQATCTSFCAATTCFTRTLYDQTAGNACGGASCDMVQTNTTLQPQFFCTGGGADTTKPYIQSEVSDTMESANNFSPNAAAEMSGALVGNVTIFTTSAMTLFNSNAASGTTGWVVAIDSSQRDAWRQNSQYQTADRAVWHSANGRAKNGGTNVTTFNVDGSQSSGTRTLTVTPGHVRLFGAATAPTTFHFGEVGFQDNILWDDAMLTALCHNERLYWGTPGTC